MAFEDDKPLLIYVHKNDHKLTSHILKAIIQDDEITKFIVGSFFYSFFLIYNIYF